MIFTWGDVLGAVVCGAVIVAIFAVIAGFFAIGLAKFQNWLDGRKPINAE